MGKRRIDPTTGEPQLTDREQRVIDEYIKNGGNGTRAAVAAGYSGARPDQAAYRVLNRPEVQRRIRERIAQSRVCADEIIGTLASIMHGRPGDLYDQSGEFSILVAKQNGADHLLKSISGTTRTIEATKTKPGQVVRTYRAQLHSPLQAANILARIFGIDRKSLARRPVSGDAFAEAMAADFRVSTWLEDLIDKQMTEQGLSRAEVAEQLLQVRPEIAKYLRELPGEQDSAAELATTDPETAIGQVLDFIIGLATNPEASPDNHPVLETHEQIQALMDELDTGAITPTDARDAITRINSRLSDQQRQDLHRLEVETFIHDNITEGHLTAEDVEAIHQQAAELADLQGAPSPQLVDQCIAEHPASHPLEPEDLPASAGQAAPTPDSGLQTRHSASNVQTCQRANVSTPDLGATKGSVEKTHLLSLFSSEPLAPDSPDSPDSPPNVQTCQPANVPTPPCQLANVPTLSPAEFESKYACIDRGFIFGAPSSYIDVIRNVMNDETLTPAQAIEEMRREGRRSQWHSKERIEQCIADYAKLHPRLAGFTIPPLPPPLKGIDRYLRQPQQPPQPALEASARPIAETPSIRPSFADLERSLKETA